MAGNNKSFLKLLESYVIFAQPPYVIAKGGNEDINSKTLYRIPSDWYTLQINHGTDHHTEMLV